MKRTAIALILVFVVLGIAPAAARADGIIIPDPVPRRPDLPLRSLAIKYHRVTVTIDGQVATTRIDQVFLNETPYDLEGDYLFPLPPGASVGEFAMWVDGQRLEAQVLGSDEARRIYEDIVRQRRDPALLEYAGQNAFRARIYPIPAHGEKRVELEYSQVLPNDGRLIRYVYPLSTEKFSTRPLEEVRVEVRIAARVDIKSVYSPSHPLSVERDGPRRAVVLYEERDVTPDADFVLYHSLDEREIGLDLLSFRREGDDGYFLLLLAPGVASDDVALSERDVVFVVDTSGSMRGEKLSQAKDAARYVLRNLNPGDRFNVIAFSSTVEAFARSLEPLERRDEALRFIDRLVSRGGTNIHQALLDALAQADDGDRPFVVLFLTDGLATEGEIRTEEIVRAVDEAAPASTRLFCFGVGYDVNTILLDTASGRHHGTSDYVQPGEDIERAVSGLYDKISMPVLTDVEVDFGDIRVADAYPSPLPDVFAGGQIVLAGRYREGGTTTLTLRGTRNGEPVTHVYREVAFRDEGGEEMLPRLWATRKIGHLLTQIRLNGPDRELVDEIVELSVRYGIVTPYTSFLVDETEDALSEVGRQALADRAYALAPQGLGAADAPGRGGGGAAAEPPASGQAAVEASLAQKALASAEAPAEPTTEGVRTVGPKSFVLRDGVWTDTAYDTATMTPQRIAFGGARYFDLLRDHPELGRYLALGPEVIVVWEGEAYRITAEEPDEPGPPPISGRPWRERLR